jgi:aspartyl-tRNA(Asn)/glutamyl-tRNA(Gln) amidotransferase subunit C
MQAKKSLTIDEVKHVAKLAKLDLTQKELVKFQKQLSDTVDFISKIDELDIKNIDPTNQTTGLENVFREDKVTTSLSQQKALANAKSQYKGFFKVKAIFEEE